MTDQSSLFYVVRMSDDTEATLSELGQWSHEDEVTEQGLNELYAPEETEEYQPNLLTGAAERVAEDFKGKIIEQPDYSRFNDLVKGGDPPIY